ncbi:hypothetical protein COOONC_00986 [Cooperia oncophora]
MTQYGIQCSIYLSRRMVDARLAYGRFEDESTEVPPFVGIGDQRKCGPIATNFGCLIPFSRNESLFVLMAENRRSGRREARRHLIDKPNVLIRIHKDALF